MSPKFFEFVLDENFQNQLIKAVYQVYYEQESRRHPAGVVDTLNPIMNPDVQAGGLAGNDKT